MLVVADTSPFIVLININHLDVLPKLFNQVVIPPEVAVELDGTIRPAAVRGFIARPPEWLIIKSPKLVEQIPLLNSGEAAAISLAREIHADLLVPPPKKETSS